MGCHADVIIIVGLIIWGCSIDKNYHWMVGQVAFFLCKLLNEAPQEITADPRSCRWSSDWQYCHIELHRGLLSSPVHERDNILLRFVELERLYQPSE